MHAHSLTASTTTCFHIRLAHAPCLRDLSMVLYLATIHRTLVIVGVWRLAHVLLLGHTKQCSCQSAMLHASQTSRTLNATVRRSPVVQPLPLFSHSPAPCVVYFNVRCTPTPTPPLSLACLFHLLVTRFPLRNGEQRVASSLSSRCTATAATSRRFLTNSLCGHVWCGCGYGGLCGGLVGWWAGLL